MVRRKKKTTKVRTEDEIYYDDSPMDAPEYETDYDSAAEYKYVTEDDSHEGYDNNWAPYRRVADRKQDAKKLIEKLTDAGESLAPVKANGRKISSTFWGRAWCRNLEAQNDYESRLPRGRSYLRNGSVIDLQISEGLISAQVLGSILYNVEITISPLCDQKWSNIITNCAGNVGSMMELLSGKISDEVMKILTDDEEGLFPLSDEIVLNCNCPDYAHMCKHLAAVLYGIGARLDSSPDLFFMLRGVDQHDLLTDSSVVLAEHLKPSDIEFDQEALEGLFEIDIILN